jgi:hypothetical protein
MGATTLDLYRAGNASSAKLDILRPHEVDTFQRNGATWVRAHTGGSSTLESPDLLFGGKWWRLAAGSTYDDKLLLVFRDQGNHWLWEPAQDMPRSDYISALQDVNGLFVRV